MNGEIGAKVEFGDFQTPVDFAQSVCEYIKQAIQFQPARIIEPTCGIGNFLETAHKTFTPIKSYGVEKNEEYYEYAKNRLSSAITLYNEDFFSFDFDRFKDDVDEEPLLIVGNPPWVNNSTLSAMDSTNLPSKSNFKGLKGLDALTGSANFDICEFMFLRLIDTFKDTNTVIALLCKTIVARNVFMELNRKSTTVSDCRMISFDAKKVFDVSVDACLFIVDLRKNGENVTQCGVYNFDNPNVQTSSFGYIGEKFYSNLTSFNLDLDGTCCFEWRQGIKHDCSKIMELVSYSEGYANGYGNVVDIENTIVFPLVKSSHIKTPVLNAFKKHVIVTQKKAREDTSFIKEVAPKTWAYLNNNSDFFDRRKSSIYKNAPPFSMFGVGEYSYAKYKVGISGFYKTPLFTLLANETPVMMDDTCYFLSFDEYDSAYTAMLLLNSSKVQTFLKSISFIDSKRPYTKKVLERLDFEKIITSCSFEDLLLAESELNLTSKITENQYNQFKTLCASS